MIMLGAFLFALAAWGIISMIKYVSKLSNEEDRGKRIKEGEKQGSCCDERIQRTESPLGKQEGTCCNEPQTGNCDCPVRSETEGTQGPL